MIDKLDCIPSPAVLFADNLDKTDINNKVLQQLKTLNWHIVATSRIALPSFSVTHAVDVLSFDECIELFKQHYERTVTDEESLNSLITIAGRHTLTVELLAKIANNDLLELADLLAQVKASDFDLSDLTDVTADAIHSGTELQSGREHQLQQHLAKLFELSSLNEQEQDILRLLAILPYQGYHAKKQLMPLLDLDKASVLVSLAKKGWLQQDEQHFALHPVLAFVAKQQVKVKVDLLSGFANEFNEAVWPSETGHWIYQVGYIEHVEVLIEAIGEVEKLNQLVPSSEDETNKSLFVVKSKLLDSFGQLLEAKGQFTQALPFYKQALEICLAIWGEDSSQVAVARNNLGDTYRELGECKQAIEYFELALKSDINNYDEEHPDVAVMRNNLAMTYESLGQYDKAIEYYQLALTSDINNFGEDHPDVAIDRNNLAGVYFAQGKYDKAIEYFELALTSGINNLGEEHPKVALRRNNLAMTYESLGQYEQAIELYQLALDCVERVFPAEHHYVQGCRNNLKDVIAKKNSQNNPKK